MRYIVDANVFLPLLTDGHALRAPALSWWDACADGDAGMSLPVRMALLRLLSNSRVMGTSTLNPERAWEVVGELISDPRVIVIEQPPQSHAMHWLANISGRLPSPDLWTDAWLAALAQATDSAMTTFDRGFLAFNKLKLQLLAPN
ncbi:MAG: PIN domain-containing protein [Rhodanobacteraceae bacterium]|nr:PIN domain-containing protein [Rhodanobacteraceae bacterium]